LQIDGCTQKSLALNTHLMSAGGIDPAQWGRPSPQFLHTGSLDVNYLMSGTSTMIRSLSVFAIIALMVGDVMAQTPPLVFTPTSQDKARIRAQSLEVDDQAKIATFRDAEFLQDDQLIRCSTLIIRYRQDTLNPEQAMIQEVACWPHEGRSR